MPPCQCDRNGHRICTFVSPERHLGSEMREVVHSTSCKRAKICNPWLGSAKICNLVCYERVGPVQGSKFPKSGKEGFGVKEILPSPNAPEKRDLSQKIPISLQGSTRKMGIFGLKASFSGPIGNGSFSTPKPSFPDFGDFDPCRGPTRSQTLCDRHVDPNRAPERMLHDEHTQKKKLR